MQNPEDVKLPVKDAGAVRTGSQETGYLKLWKRLALSEYRFKALCRWKKTRSNLPGFHYLQLSWH